MHATNIQNEGFFNMVNNFMDGSDIHYFSNFLEIQ